MSDHHHEIDMSEVYQLPHQEVSLSDFPPGEEWILDIGGGGENADSESARAAFRECQSSCCRARSESQRALPTLAADR